MIEAIEIQVEVLVLGFLESLFFHPLTLLVEYGEFVNNVLLNFFLSALFYFFVMLLSFLEHFSNLAFRIEKPRVVGLVLDTADLRHLLVFTKQYFQRVRWDVGIIGIDWLVDMINVIIVHQLEGHFIHFDVMMLIDVSLRIN